MERLFLSILIIAVFSAAFAKKVEGAGDKMPGAKFYIATNGNDAWSGKIEAPNAKGTDGPFATLEKARDEVRALKQKGPIPEGGITIFIRSGVYNLKQTLELTAEDSGEASRPIIYRAYEGEEVRLNGGVELDAKWFKPVTDHGILDRIPDQAKSNVLQADLKAHGITDYGELKPRRFGSSEFPAALELFFDDRPMQIARWPNSGWVKITAVPAGSAGGRFTFGNARMVRWTRAEDLWLHGYWTWNWADSYEKVKSINTQVREIATFEPHGVYGYRAGGRFYVLNLIEELDAPGEWYLDRGTGILYFWPPKPMDQGRISVSILEKPLVLMRDVSDVIFRGMTFEVTRGHGVEIKGGERNLIAGDIFRNIGQYAVRIDGGTEHGVTGCDIFFTGEGGIRLDSGDRKTLTPGKSFIVNNHIHDYSLWVRTNHPAVGLYGVGNLVANNLIHDAPHEAILFNGNENVIEYNEVHHVDEETSDAGAFYIGRNWTERGNIIRYNFFHHITGPTDIITFDINVVYLDDCASDTTVFGNVFYKTARGVFIGGGRDNVVENNIFVDSNPALRLDARGLNWARDSVSQGGVMQERLFAMNYKQPPFSERYPELVNILEDELGVPKNNRIERNVRVRGKWLDLTDEGQYTPLLKDNFTQGDPMFVDPEKMNFQLKDDSPVYKLGFQRIPMEKIGLFVDEYRTRLPAEK